MTKSNIAQDPSTSVRSNRWHFTLREMFFAFAAIGALLALYLQSRPYAETSFFGSNDPELALATICKQVGLTLSSSSTGGRKGSSPKSANKELHLVVELPENSMSRLVMTRLLEATEKELRENGCWTTGRGVTGNRAENSVLEFSFDYQSGNTRGIYRAFSFPDTNNRWRLCVINIEW